MGVNDKPSIAITTTSALVKVFCELIPRKDWPKAFTRLWMAVDEAHHISAVLADDEDCTVQERDQYNKQGTWLGRICESLLNESDAGLVPVSATHFRGDGLPMFLEEANKFFTGSYVREFEAHWQWLGYDHFSYDLVGYDDDPSDILFDNIMFERNEHHIICVPADGLRFRKYNKNWILDFIKRLEAAGFSCLDLVSKNVKDDNKKKLLADNKSYKITGETQFNVVIACNLMREGTDWIPASRIHDLAPSKSATRTVQTIGRMLRKDENKIDLAYIPYFLNLHKHADKEEIRRYVTGRVNVALSGMLLAENLFAPVYLDTDDTGKRRTRGECEEDLFGHERDFIRQNFLTALNDLDSEPTSADIDSCAEKALANYKGDFLSAIKVLRELARFVLRMNEEIDPDIRVVPSKLNVDEIREAGFDPVKRWSGLRIFISQTHQEDLRKLREIVRPMQNKLNDMMNRAARHRMNNLRGKQRDKKAEAYIRKIKKRPTKTPAELSIAPTGSNEAGLEI
jgi:hypothetical protein